MIKSALAVCRGTLHFISQASKMRATSRRENWPVDLGLIRGRASAGIVCHLLRGTLLRCFSLVRPAKSANRHADKDLVYTLGLAGVNGDSYSLVEMKSGAIANDHALVEYDLPRRRTSRCSSAVG
jgi:hypothetical protein